MERTARLVATGADGIDFETILAVRKILWLR